MMTKFLVPFCQNRFQISRHRRLVACIHQPAGRFVTIISGRRRGMKGTKLH